MKTVVLGFAGFTGDVKAWLEGCHANGVSVAARAIGRPGKLPTHEAVRTALRTSADWFFFSGHLWAEKDEQVRFGATKKVGVHAFARGVSLVGLPSERLRAHSPEFLQRSTLPARVLTFWSGCSALHVHSLRVLWPLFGPHVMLGFSNLMGKGMTSQALTRTPGGLFSTDSSRQATVNYSQDPEQVHREMIAAWLRVGWAMYHKKASWYPPRDRKPGLWPYGLRYAAVDPTPSKPGKPRRWKIGPGGMTATTLNLERVD